jgi:hypothetical protein
MRRAGRSLACAAVWVACFAVMPASAQELSDKATRAFMEYAWSLTPEAFTKPNGETIQIDKTKKDQVMIPLDVARDVIRAGRLSAHAQVCELTQEQADNHNSLMRRETLSKKWTPQQLVYINQLHLTVVMLLTGRVKLVEKGDDKGGDKGDKEVVIEEGTKQAQTCTAEQKQKVKELITAYVKSGPAAPTPAAGPASTAAPASTDQPAASPSPPASPAPAAAPGPKAAPSSAQK